MHEGRTVSGFDDDIEAAAYLNQIDGYRSAGQFSLCSTMTSRKQLLDSKHKNELKRMDRDKKEQVEVKLVFFKPFPVNSVDKKEINLRESKKNTRHSMVITTC
jgi:hypothetical protein